jgi:HSP20 family molecular chaperone IbpA
MPQTATRTASARTLAQFFHGFARGLVSLPVHAGDKDLVKDFAIDIQEYEDRYVLRAEIAGMRKQDIQIGLSPGRLSVCATLLPCKKRQVHDASACSTPCYASALRPVQLPAEADLGDSVASFHDGWLTLIVAKRRPRASA